MNIRNLSPVPFRLGLKTSGDAEICQEVILSSMLKYSHFHPYFHPYFHKYMEHCVHPTNKKPNKLRDDFRQMAFSAILDIASLMIAAEEKTPSDPFYLIYGFHPKKSPFSKDDELFRKLIESKTKYIPLHFSLDGDKINNLTGKIIIS